MSDDSALKSNLGVDYTQLRNLLAAKKWKEANDQTAKVMLEVARILATSSTDYKLSEDYPTCEDIELFPDEDLCTIDELWIKYSNGRFGFSPQTQIFQDLGGLKEDTVDYEIWCAFTERLGWSTDQEWFPYDDLTWELASAPVGHLPWWGMVRAVVGCWHVNVDWVELYLYISGLARKLATCNRQKKKSVKDILLAAPKFDELTPEQRQRIVDRYIADERPWSTKPLDDYALWNHLAEHLNGAGRKAQLRELLLNFDWLQAKLNATDIHSLIADYDFLHDDADLKLVREALRLSSHILGEDKTQLAGQLLGRLLSVNLPAIQGLLEQAKQWNDAPWLRPLTPSLSSPGGPLLRTLKGHTGWINTIVITPDGKRIVSCDDSRLNPTLKVWDLETGQELFSLTGHTEEVNCLTVTPDSRWVISSSFDETVKIWDLETAQQLFSFPCYRINSLTVTPDGKRLIAYNGLQLFPRLDRRTVKVWDLQAGEELFSLKGQAKRVTSVVVTPDGQRLISASQDKTVRVWDLETGKRLSSLPGCSDSVVTALDDERVIVQADDKTLQVWDLKLRTELVSFPIRIPSFLVTPDRKRVISLIRGDRTIRSWNVDTGAQLATLKGYTVYTNHLIFALAVTPDSKKVIANASEMALKVWDLETGQELCELTGHTKMITAIAVHPNSKWVVSGSWDNTLKIWDLEKAEKARTPIERTRSINALAFTPDSRRVVSGSDDGTLKVWDLETRRELFALTGHARAVKALAVTPDGKRLISGDDDETLKLWNLETGEELRRHIGRVTALAITPDGKRVISGEGFSGTIKVGNLETGEELFALVGHTDSVDAIAVTPDGKRMISASGFACWMLGEWEDHTLKVWDLETGEQLRSFTGDARGVNALVVTADGKRVIYGTDVENNLKVWDLETAEEPFSLSGHTKQVNALAITPNGDLMISASDDTTIKVWNVQNLQVIASFSGNSSFTCCAIAPDGLNIVLGEESGQLHFLQLEGVQISR